MEQRGDRYGAHRVIAPKGVLAQAAQTLDNSLDIIYDNEIICDVISLNIDSASFTQIKGACGGDAKKMEDMILSIVGERGKMQNPVTGSGGMFIGRVRHLGSALQGRDLKVGDTIASLVSLSLTPLRIERVKAIHMGIDRVDMEGTAILFESAIYAKLPEDMGEALALAALDVAGAPAQTAKLVKPGDSVLILGAAGKSGILCCYAAMKAAGPSGRVVGLVLNETEKARLTSLGLCHDIVVESATRPLDVLAKTLPANGGKEYDLSISCVNVDSTEMSCILPVRDGGMVYFFSMATSFSKAALGAEGVGKDVSMLIGNGYTKDHAVLTLDILREHEGIRNLFAQIYQ